MPDNKAIIVKTDLLVAVARWAPKENHRPHLHMVLFKNDEMVALDGHRMVRVPIKTNGLTIGIDPALIYAAATAQEQCKEAAPKTEDGDRAIRISLQGGLRAALDIGRFTLLGPSADHTMYPPYHQVMPNERPERHPDGYGFSPRYLAAIHEVESAAGALEGGNGLRVTGWSADGLGPMLFEGYKGIRYVVMPMRV